MIDDPGAYFRNLGEFHDAQLAGIRWLCSLKIIELAINDYRAAIDADDVPGDVQGALAFSEVTNLFGTLEDSDLYISQFSVERDGRHWDAKLILKSGATLSWTFGSVAEMELRA